MQITTLDKTERWLIAALAVMAVLALVVVGAVARLLLAGPGQAAGAALATPAGTAVSQAQTTQQAEATRAAQLAAGYAAAGLQPTRLEMARLELTSAGQVAGAHSGPLRDTALAASVQQCVQAGRQVSNRLYVEFGPGQVAQAQAGTLTFLFRAPAGRWQIVAEAVAGPERTGQMAGQVTVTGGAEPQVVTMPVLSSVEGPVALGSAGGLSLYAVGANDRRCDPQGPIDPAEGAFIGKPVFTKAEG